MGLDTRQHLYVSLLAWSLVLTAAMLGALVLIRLLGADVNGLFP